MDNIPYDITKNIFKLANNRCFYCNKVCEIPHKKLGNLYYCSKECFKKEYNIENFNNYVSKLVYSRFF